MHVYHIGRDFIFLLYFSVYMPHTRYEYAQCSNKTVTLFNIAWNCCEVRAFLPRSLSLSGTFSFLYSIFFLSQWFIICCHSPFRMHSFIQSVRSAAQIPELFTKPEQLKKNERTERNEKSIIHHAK